MEIRNVENTNPLSFEDVKVFAGDNFFPASDASYRNLIWESNAPGVTENFRGGNKVTIPSWCMRDISPLVPSLVTAKPLLTPGL